MLFLSIEMLWLVIINFVFIYSGEVSVIYNLRTQLVVIL